MENFGFQYSGTENSPRMIRVLVHKIATPIEHIINACHPEEWVLDYNINTPKLFNRVEGSNWFLRPPGTAHLYRPGTRYWERCDYSENSYVQCAFITFRGEMPFLRSMTENKMNFAQIVDENCDLKEAMIATAQAATGNRGYWKCMAEFCRAMELLESASAFPENSCRYILSRENSQHRTLAEQVLEYLEQNYRKPIEMQELAEMFQCSPSTIAHKFRAEFKTTVVEQLQKIRIQQSIPLLQRGFPLKVIAAETGFANEFYFSRVFRKIIGASPREYRKKLLS